MRAPALIAAAAIVLVALTGCAASEDDAMGECVSERFDALLEPDPGADVIQLAFDQCEAELAGDRDRFMREYTD